MTHYYRLGDVAELAKATAATLSANLFESKVLLWFRVENEQLVLLSTLQATCQRAREEQKSDMREALGLGAKVVFGFSEGPYSDWLRSRPGSTGWASWRARQCTEGVFAGDTSEVLVRGVTIGCIDGLRPDDGQPTLELMGFVSKMLTKPGERFVRPEDLFVDGVGGLHLLEALGRSDAAAALQQLNPLIVADQPTPDAASVAVPKKAAKKEVGQLSLTRERTLHRVIGALVLKLQEERLTRKHRVATSKAVIADVVRSAPELAKAYRLANNIRHELDAKFGLGDDTVSKTLREALNAILQDSWHPEAKDPK